MKREIEYIIGIDEAGRGPLAGPVAVGAVCVHVGFDWESIPGVTDSKKLSAEKREVIFRRAQSLKRQGLLTFSVTLVSARTIDTHGITAAVSTGINKSLDTLHIINPQTYDVRLDGLLKAPAKFIHQSTIVKGDATEKVIGLASIMAKVTRDRVMIKFASQYPAYGFELHKGYGTERHRKILQKRGLSPIHRKTFCKKFLHTL